MAQRAIEKRKASLIVIRRFTRFARARNAWRWTSVALCAGLSITASAQQPNADVPRKDGVAAGEPAPSAYPPNGAFPQPGGPPLQVGLFGDWGVYTVKSEAGDPQCFAISQPRERVPQAASGDDDFFFLTRRPREGRREEISLTTASPNDENGAPKAEVGGMTFDLIARGTNMWVRRNYEEIAFVSALESNAKLVVTITPASGPVVAETYRLEGLPRALARIRADCP